MKKCPKTTSPYVIRNFLLVLPGLLLPLLLLAILGGCLPPDKEFGNKWADDLTPFADMGQNVGNNARLSCFLSLMDSEAPALIMEIADIEVLSDNLWLNLTSGPLKIDSAAIGDGQIFLASIAVPAGRYQRLRFTVTQGQALKADGKYEIISSEPLMVEIKFTDELVLDPEDSKSLLIFWDVKSSIQPDNTLGPVLTAAAPLKQMLLNLVFAACPDINTIFVIRADKNWVVDSFGLRGSPSYLAIDPVTSRQRLYVLAVHDQVVLVVDLSNFRIIDFFPAPLNDKPSFMTISADGQSAFLLDEQSGYLSRMDLSTGRIISRVQLGYKPNYAVYLSEQNLLAVSLSLSQKVLLIDPESMIVLSTITTGNSPQGMTVSNDQLYITEHGDNTISVSNLSSRATQVRISVGFGPRRVLSTGNRIYVSNYLDDSLSVLVPGQSGVIQEIYRLGRPLEMAFNEFYQKLYVVDEDAAGLAVIDTNSNLLKGHIVLGAKPLGLAVIQ